MSKPTKKAVSGPLRKQRVGIMKHGLHITSQKAIRSRNEQVRQMVVKMFSVMPWLQDSDRPACRGWAELEIIGAMMFANLTDEGILLPTGEPRRLVDNFRQLRQSQLQFANALGMTPAARKLLSGDPDADLPLLLARLSKEQHEPEVVRETDENEDDDDRIN